MSTIVTRAGKGSALTWTEGDANITNLNTDKLEHIVSDLTPQLGGSLDVNGNSIVSTLNGNIVLEPNGTGDVNLKADTILIGDSDAGNVTITNNNTGFLSIVHATYSQGLILGGDGSIGITPANGMGFYLGDNIGLNPVNIVSGSSGIYLGTDANNPSSITISGAANGHITIAPDGTGDVRLDADTVRVGDSNAAATITTNGAGTLTLNTNSGTNSGSIAIAPGTNANITIATNGTGSTVFNSQAIATRTNNVNGSIVGRAATTTSGAYQYPGVMVQKNRTDIATASMTNEPAVLGFSVRDNTSTNTNFARFSAVYQGSGTNPFFKASVSTNGFTTSIDSVIFGAGTAQWGNSTSSYTHTTPSTGNLTFSTNQGTNSGTITINSGANANISITPNGTGAVDFGDTRPGSKIQYRRTYGCFHKMADITAAAADTVYAFDWTTNVTAHVNTQGVTVSNTSRLNIDAAGEYNVALEMHAQNTDNVDRAVFVWLAKNGTDLSESCIKVVLTKDTSTVIAKTWLVEGITAGQYLEVRFAVDNTSGISLQHEAALSTPYVRPAVASATITISPVGA